MNCPICKTGNLNNFDDVLLVCEGDCGAEFGLEYLGIYEDGEDERTDDGFESEAWKKIYQKKLETFKSE